MNKKIIDHFKKADPVILPFVMRVEKLKPRKTKDYFQSLCREIVGQQLSGKVARVIYSRFTALFPDEKPLPHLTLKIPEKRLRNTGIAWSKVAAIKDLAQKTSDGTVNLEKINKLQNEKITEELMKVKGIGPWTAEMFLIFTLGKEDIFSEKDLGLKKALKNIYNTDNFEKITRKWKPYRTYGSLALWESLKS